MCGGRYTRVSFFRVETSPGGGGRGVLGAAASVRVRNTTSRNQIDATKKTVMNPSALNLSLTHTIINPTSSVCLLITGCFVIITRVSLVVKMCVFLMGFGGADTHFLSFFYSAQILFRIQQCSAFICRLKSLNYPNFSPWRFFKCRHVFNLSPKRRILFYVKENDFANL